MLIVMCTVCDVDSVFKELGVSNDTSEIILYDNSGLVSFVSLFIFPIGNPVRFCVCFMDDDCSWRRGCGS